MKKLLLLFSMGFLFYFGNAQSYTINFGKSEPGIKFVETKPEKLIMSFNYGGLNAVNLNTQKGVYSQIDLMGAYRSGNVGEPQLPASRKLIQVPFGATVSVKVLSSEVSEYILSDYGIDKKILPFQPSYSKSIDPSTVDFIVNEGAYQQNSFIAQELASVETMGTMRGIRLAQVEVNPLQYNPVTNTIRVYNNVNIEVTFTDGNQKQTESMRLKSFSPYFETLYNDFIGTGSTTKNNYTDNPDHTKYPVKYLIVTAPQFADQLASFIDWKTKKGFEVIMVTTDEIGTTATAIKTWIHAQYNAGTETDPAPTFFLLVGDTPQIPASQNGTDSQKATDLYYACVDGTGDIFPDMYYGRFSAQTTTQLQNMLDKVLYYEKYQFADDTYLNHTTLIAGADGSWNPAVGQPTINYGTTNYFNAAHGFTNVNAYLNSYSGCYNADKIAVGYINYTAHCSETSWGDPTLTQSAVNAFTNANKYPLAIGNCCLAADFGTSECIGETWMRKANAGSVAYIGSSPSSYWYEDFYWSVGAHSYSAGNAPSVANSTVGAYDAPYVSDYLCVDALVFVGNLAVSEAHDIGTSTSISEKYYWEAYNCLSDPSLFIYLTQADENAVTHLPTVPIGVSQYEVSAEPGSYVGISKDGVLHGAALVPESGTVTVSIDPIVSGGNVDIVVTKDQYKPYITSVPAASLNGPYLTVDAMTINDASANNNGTAEYGEAFNLELTIKNVGSQTSQGITASISTSSPYVASFTNNSNVAVSDIATNASGTVTGSFNLVLTNTVPDQQAITFNITLTDNASKKTYESTKTIKVNAPELVATSFVIDDSGSGNGDNILDPEETALLIVTIKNTGHATISADAELSFLNGSSTLMSITDADATIGSISAGASATAEFTVYANAGIAPGTPEDLTIMINATQSAYSASEDYQVIIGLIPEFNMGSQASVTTSVGLFYDSGGLNGQYQNGENHTITFLPTIAGRLIKVSFNSFATEANYDYLKIYDGTSASATQLGSFSGTTMPGTYVASNNSGALTFVFTSDGSATANGWEASIETVDPVNLNFVVTDGTNPVAGAEVTFDGETVTTNANGEAMFIYLSKKAVKDYSVSAIGYFDYQGTVTVTNADITENVVLSAKPRYDITFSVTSASTNIENVQIAFNNATQLTDASGLTTFNNVIEGYTLQYTASKANYVSVQGDVLVDANKTIEVVLNDNILDPAIIGVQNLREGEAKITWSAGTKAKLFEGYSVYLDDFSTPIASNIANFEYVLSGLTNGQTYKAAIQGLYSTGESEIDSIEFTYHQVFTIGFYATVNGVAQANVQVRFNNQTQNTDVTGSVAFNLESAGLLSYSAQLIGYYTIEGSVTTANDSIVELPLVFIPDVTFIVNDQNGAPLNGAKAVFNNLIQYTNPNGVVTFTDVMPNDELPVLIKLDNYTSFDSTISVGDENISIEVTLGKLSTITFLVNDASGAPMIDARVKFNNIIIKTDAAGEAQFVGVPSGPKQAYKIYKTDFLSIYDSIDVAFNDVTIENTLYVVPNVTFVVTKNTVAQAGIPVKFNNQSLTTNASGEVVFAGIQSGNYPYSVTVSGHYPINGEVSVVNTSVSVPVELNEIPDVTITVEEKGAPMANVSVKLGDLSKLTDANGQANFVDVVQGKYAYELSLNGYYTISDSLTIEDLDIDLPIELVAIPDAKFVITDGTNPIAGAKVTFAGTEKVTNTLGEVSFIDVLAGKHKIVVEKNLFNVYTDSIVMALLDLDETIVMELTTYAVSFTVTDGTNPISGANVTVNTISKLTNENGVAVFEGLPIADDYNYSISKAGYHGASGSFNVTDSDVNKPIELVLITYTVSFNVSDSDGPVNGAQVAFNNQSLTTGLSGNVEFANVVPAENMEYSVTKNETHTQITGTVTVSQNQVVDVLLHKVGLNDVDENKFAIYPNPSNGSITIQIESGVAENLTIEITDQSGRIVSQVNSTDVINNIDLSTLNKGVYFVKIQNATIQKVEKIIIN